MNSYLAAIASAKGRQHLARFRPDEFSTRWARHDVHAHRSADETLHNTIVGDINLTGDALDCPATGS